jgi:hypothetical protein
VLRVRDGGGQPRGWHLIGLALAAVACVGLGAPAAAQSSSPLPDALEVAKAPAQIRDYWTAERMREAIPMGPVAGAEDSSDAPKRGSTIAKRVGHVRQRPKRTHGKVFLTLGGIDYVCSATSVAAPSRSLVWSAGHCVYEPGLLGGSFATNWEFVPAYRNGHAPFGEWPATKLQSTPQWKNSGGICVVGVGVCGNVSFDLGAASVASNGGRKLRNRVGARGIVFNYPRDQVYRPFGYPAEPPFDGEHMYRCRSGYGGADGSAEDPKPMRITCDMTGGSSGGGWVTGSGDVASIVSYGYEGEPNKLYGPYQGAAAKNLYNDMKKG